MLNFTGVDTVKVSFSDVPFNAKRILVKSISFRDSATPSAGVFAIRSTLFSENTSYPSIHFIDGCSYACNLEFEVSNSQSQHSFTIVDVDNAVQNGGKFACNLEFYDE